MVLVALALALALALPDTSQAISLNEIKKLAASDAAAFNSFGGSIAVSGDTVVIGAFGSGAFDELSGGAAYVVQRNEGGALNWGEVKKLTASDTEVYDAFGSSVAISGDTIVVGAHKEDTEGNQAGAAYVFERDEGGADNWGEVKKLTASDAQSEDWFGRSVAVSGDTALVGAELEDSGGTNAGAVYVFQRDEGGAGTWGETKKFIASDAQAGDQFGVSVAFSGETVVVGAFVEDAGGADAGAAYVFQRNEGGVDNWGEVKKLTASDAQNGDLFGVSVAVGGDTAIVGAMFEDAGGSDAGAAYVFQRDEGGVDNWGEVEKVIASDAQADDAFGGSVALSGDSALVGAPSDAGAAYVFQRDEGGTDNWGEVDKLIASDAQADDAFGRSVALNGDIAFVGANWEDAGGTNAGAAYVFDLLLPKPTPTVTLTPTITPTPRATLPPGVGGISLDSDLRALPVETPQSSSSPSLGMLASGVAVGAVAAALASAAWRARRRSPV